MKTLPKLLIASAIVLCISIVLVIYLKPPIVPSFPLHEAIRENNVERVRELIEGGYDVNERTRLPYGTPIYKGMPRYHVSPLHIATEMEVGDGDPDGPLKIVRLLLEHGADVDVADSYSRTPISKAILRALAEHYPNYSTPKKWRVVQENDTNVNAADSHRETPTAEVIIRMTREHKQKDSTPNTWREVLHLILTERPSMAMNGHDRPAIIKFAKLSSYDDIFLDTALQCHFSEPQIITGIQQAISAMNPPPRSEYVVNFDPREMLELILQHETDPRYLAAALVAAVRRDDIELAQELIHRGADPNLRVGHRRSATSYAEARGYEQLLDLMRSRSQ